MLLVANNYICKVDFDKPVGKKEDNLHRAKFLLNFTPGDKQSDIDTEEVIYAPNNFDASHKTSTRIFMQVLKVETC